jgi:hypothetical protein
MHFLGFKPYLLALNIYLHPHNQQKHMFLVFYTLYSSIIYVFIWKIEKIKSGHARPSPSCHAFGPDTDPVHYVSCRISERPANPVRLDIYIQNHQLKQTVLNPNDLIKVTFSIYKIKIFSMLIKEKKNSTYCLS